MKYKIVINRTVRKYIVKPLGIRWKSIGGEMTDVQMGAVLDTFTPSTPLETDYLILGGKKKTLLSAVVTLLGTVFQPKKLSTELYTDAAEKALVATISGKQNSTDNSLNTTSKTVAGAINEVRGLALEIPIGKVFATKADLDTWLLTPANKASLKNSQNLLIIALDTPDYWWDFAGQIYHELEGKLDLSGYLTAVQIALAYQPLKAALELYVSQVEKNTWNGKQDALTDQSLGTLINSATEKTDLVDADKIPIADSADGNKLKRWSYAKLKLQLSGIYAKLSGGNTFADTQVFSGNVKVTKIVPNADGATAIQFMKADGTTVSISINTLNGHLVFINDGGFSNSSGDFSLGGGSVNMRAAGSGNVRIQNGIITSSNQLGTSFANRNRSINVPTAIVHLQNNADGLAGNAPLKFTAGVNLTTPEIGAVEYDGKNLYLTPTNLRRAKITTSDNGYTYLDVYSDSDSLNDIRNYNNAGVLTYQKCTVANAVKGAGTWVTFQTFT